MLNRLFPLGVILVAVYVVPWATRMYLISGLSGKNFSQTDVSNCDIIYPATLLGCEDLHVYPDGPNGPMIFTGCASKFEDQFVLPG